VIQENARWRISIRLAAGFALGFAVASCDARPARMEAAANYASIYLGRYLEETGVLPRNWAELCTHYVAGIDEAELASFAYFGDQIVLSQVKVQDKLVITFVSIQPNDLEYHYVGMLRRTSARGWSVSLEQYPSEATLVLLLEPEFDPDATAAPFTDQGRSRLRECADQLSRAIGLDSAQVLERARTSRARKIELLQKQWEASGEADRIGLAYELARLGDRNAEELLIRFLEDQTNDPDLRAIAAQRIGWAGIEKALPLLRKLLSDARPKIRGAVAEAIGRLGTQEDIEDLMKAADVEKDAITLRLIGEAVERLGRTR
jgi:hypothetical protein